VSRSVGAQLRMSALGRMRASFHIWQTYQTRCWDHVSTSSPDALDFATRREGRGGEGTSACGALSDPLLDLLRAAIDRNGPTSRPPVFRGSIARLSSPRARESPCCCLPESNPTNRADRGDGRACASHRVVRSCSDPGRWLFEFHGTIVDPQRVSGARLAGVAARPLRALRA
jgi:hypothetical protein